jgi:hypothetical protein
MNTNWKQVVIGLVIAVVALLLFAGWYGQSRRIKELEAQVWKLEKDLGFEQRTGVSYQSNQMEAANNTQPDCRDIRLRAKNVPAWLRYSFLEAEDCVTEQDKLDDIQRRMRDVEFQQRMDKLGDEAHPQP